MPRAPRESETSKRRRAKIVKAQFGEDDWDYVVTCMGAAGRVPESQKQKFIAIVNLVLPWTAKMQAWRRERPPHENLALLDKLEAACSGALTALREAYVGVALTWEHDRSTGQLRAATPSELRAWLPELSDVELQARARAGNVFPSLDAVGTLHSLVESLQWAQARSKEARRFEEARQERLGGKRQPNRPDEARFQLVLALEAPFSSVFRMAPSGYVDGSWIIFLAALLTRCEGEDLSARGALDLWRRARQWQTSQEDASSMD